MASRIPVYEPDLSGREKAYVNECIDSSWISSKGRFVDAFESSFASYIGVRHGLSVSNGTIAVHLAMLALGIGPGDEVITPTLTYIATVNPIRYVGAKPVFAESIKETWQLDPDDVERRITSKTKAIIVVHLYGHACDMDRFVDIARRHGIFLIEDCAEAIGTTYKGVHVGGFGDVSVFSFYGNKMITTGEGGMLVTNSEDRFRLAKRIKGQGLADNREYWHDILGHNFRMTNVCCAIGLAQLERVEEFIARKRRIAERYRTGLSNSTVVFHGESDGTVHSYWMCSILVPHSSVRDAVRKALADAGVETRPLFYPVHTMPMYATDGATFPVAEDIASRGINLPSGPTLALEDVDRICRIVKDAC